MSSRRFVYGEAVEASPFPWVPLHPGQEPAPEPQPEAPAPPSEPVEAVRERERAAWQQESERRLAQAVDEAYARGQRQALETMRQEHTERLQRVADTVETLVRLRPRLRAQAERDVVQLALAIAKRVVRRELHCDPEALVGIAHTALERASGCERGSLRVSLTDEAFFRSALRTRLAQPGWELIADPNLPPGSLRLQTVSGEFDASIDTQLLEIERGLADLLPEER